MTSGRSGLRLLWPDEGRFRIMVRIVRQGNGVIRASAERLAISSRQFTVGSPKGFDTPVLKDARVLLDQLT